MNMRSSRSAPAYRHVDIDGLPAEIKTILMDDANGGGKAFGLEIVEVAHNGGAQVPIFGVYKHNEELWAEAKAEFGIDEEGEVDLTGAAAEAAADAGDALRQQEEEAVRAVAENQGTNKKK